MRFLAPTSPVDLLSCPTNASPGFDITHQASRAVSFSAIPMGGNLYNLRGRKAANLVGTTPASLVHPVIGRSTFATASYTSQFTGGQVSGSGPGGPGTIAAIASFNSFSVNSNFCDITPSFFSVALYVNTSGVLITFYGNTIGDVTSGMTLSLNTPYFVVTSWYSQFTHWVVTNLRTGAMRYTSNNSGSQNSGLSSPEVGPIFGNLAAVMHSLVFMNKNDLLQWGQNPWDFWYPQSQQDYVGIYTAAAASPAFLRNLPMIGVG